MVAFPEMVLTGYPVEDLALRGSFVDASRQALQGSPSSSRPTGSASWSWSSASSTARRTPYPSSGTPKGAPQNAAAVLHRGRVVGRYAKHHLPNYGVFDEYRYFVPGDSLTVVRVHGVDVAVAICEDLWQEGGPVAVTREAGAGLLLVINGSPYERNKDDIRLDLVRRRAAEAGCALAYVNMVGGQDELVFDGDSLVVAADGEVLARAPQFDDRAAGGRPRPARGRRPAAPTSRATSRRLTARRRRSSASCSPPSRCRPTSPRPPRSRTAVADEAEVYAALVTALRDYVAQERVPQRGARPVRRHRLGAGRGDRLRRDRRGERVRRLDARASTPREHSRTDAADLAERTGLNFQTVPIAPDGRRVPGRPGADRARRGEPAGAGPRRDLMALSNQHGHLVLATGNKSELAVGYSTIYGDAVGGFAPLKDVPKTWCGSWPAGATPTPRRAARHRRSRRRRSASRRRPSCGPASWTPTRCPPYECSTTSSTTTSSTDRGSGELLAAGFDPELVEEVLRLVDRGGVQAPAVPAGPEDHVQGVRPRPAAADHQPLARARSGGRRRQAVAPMSGVRGLRREPRGTLPEVLHDRDGSRPTARAPAPADGPRRSGCASTTCAR